MKTKLLLTGLVTLLSSATISAADYVYTNSARYKIVGENQLIVGSVEDALASWRSASGTALDQMPDTFEVVQDAALGDKALKVVKGGAGATIFNADVMLNPGTYYISYKVKGVAERAGNALTLTSANCQNIFANADGSASLSADGYKAIATSQFYYNEWQTVAYTVTVSAEEMPFLVYYFGNLVEGDEFADFEVLPVEEVGDDRNLLRAIDRAQMLMAMPELQNGVSDMQYVIDAVKGMMTDIESASDFASLYEQFETQVKEYLNANGADASSYFKNFTFDNLSPKGNSTVSGWNTGSRWGTGAANAEFATVHASQTIGNSYELGASSLSQSQAMPAGKYLYVISARGWDNPNKSSNIDYKAKVTGIKMFVNADSLELEDLPSYGPKNYAKVFEVKEGEALNLGVHNTATSNSNDVRFDNHYLYYLSGTSEDLENYYQSNLFKSIQNATQTMIDNANEYYAKAEYKFGKPELKDSIDNAANILATETTPVEDNEAVETSRVMLKNQLSRYQTINAEVVTLYNDIAETKPLLDDEAYLNGKNDLKEAVDAAEALYNAIDPAVRDSAAIAKMDESLLAARTAFYVANATYNTPGEIYLEEYTFAGASTSRGKEVPGWDDANIGRNGSSGWALSKNDMFATGCGIVYSRNSNSCEKKYLAQTVDLKYPGVYEFSADARAYRANKGTQQNTGVFLFIGKGGEYTEAKYDSVQVWTPVVNGDGDKAQKYWTVRVVISEPQSVRVGIDALNNAFGNKIYMSDCHLRYFGPYDAYQRDSVMAVAKPTVDSLGIVIAAAKAFKEETRNKDYAVAGVKVFTDAISHAEGVYATPVENKEMLDAVDNEIIALHAAMEAYKVCGVWPAEGKCFDLTSYIKNADFAAELESWNSDGNTMYMGTNPAVMTYKFFADQSNMEYMKLHQTIEGMPEGAFQLLANATYRMNAALDYTYPQDADMEQAIRQYDTNESFFVVANNDSIEMRGLLKGRTIDDYAEILSGQDYRHDRVGKAFIDDYSLNTLGFKVTAEDNGKIDFGLSVKKPVDTAILWAKDFRLLYWGDTLPTAVESVTAGDNNVDVIGGDLYNLSGQKVNKSYKGIVIMKGKAYIAK